MSFQTFANDNYSGYTYNYQTNNTNWVACDFQGYASDGYYVGTTAGQPLRLYLPAPVVNNENQLYQTYAATSSTTTNPYNPGTTPNLFGQNNLVYAIGTYFAPPNVAYANQGFPVFTNLIPAQYMIPDNALNRDCLPSRGSVPAQSHLDGSFTDGNSEIYSGWSICSSGTGNCVLSCFYRPWTPPGVAAWPVYLSQWGVGTDPAVCDQNNTGSTQESVASSNLQSANMFQFGTLDQLYMYQQTSSTPSSSDPVVYTFPSGCTWIPIPYLQTAGGSPAWVFGFADHYMYSTYDYSYIHTNVYAHTPCPNEPQGCGYFGYFYMYYSSLAVNANLAIPGVDAYTYNPSINRVFPFVMDPAVWNLGTSSNVAYGNGVKSVRSWTDVEASNTPVQLVNPATKKIYYFCGCHPVNWYYVQYLTYVTIAFSGANQQLIQYDNDDYSFATMQYQDNNTGSNYPVSTGQFMMGSIIQNPPTQSGYTPSTNIPPLFKGLYGYSTSTSYSLFNQFAPSTFFS